MGVGLVAEVAPMEDPGGELAARVALKPAFVHPTAASANSASPAAIRRIPPVCVTGTSEVQPAAGSPNGRVPPHVAAQGSRALVEREHLEVLLGHHETVLLQPRVPTNAKEPGSPRTAATTSASSAWPKAARSTAMDTS
ncbi:MAG: hypothetical protein ACXVEI_02615 [Actinomycetota bacterium]